VSTDRYLDRRYDKRHYNCAHLVCEVWADLRGPDMAEALRGFLCGPSGREARLSDLRRLRFLDTPEEPCVVLLQAPRRAPHVGVWVRGKVLHITERGVFHQRLEIAALGFTRARFITC
jgi:hypothetical protein